MGRKKWVKHEINANYTVAISNHLSQDSALHLNWVLRKKAFKSHYPSGTSKDLVVWIKQNLNRKQCYPQKMISLGPTF
ncbi:hypothetical protein Y1Q_0007082 [Alligator mississippiensis]|uniref:Uncharacterized protein n=1 Tax=Alligator mississippiensis TaxID=8496 RepID=A0A151N6B7_ALLMI|nr:hypothetical protein Y1Q_0007082 [Alligator mississippiensis]